MQWPWQRTRSAEQPPARVAPDAPTPPPMGWAFLPPLQRAVADAFLVSRPGDFASHLPAWRDPTFLTPGLAHAVSPLAPGGVLDGDGAGTPTTRTTSVELTLLPAARPSLQRATVSGEAVASFTRTSTAALPVLQLTPVEDPAEDLAEHPAEEDRSLPEAIPPFASPAAPAASPVQRSVEVPAPRRYGLGAPLPSMPATRSDEPVASDVAPDAPVLPLPLGPAGPDLGAEPVTPTAADPNAGTVTRAVVGPPVAPSPSAGSPAETTTDVAGEAPAEPPQGEPVTVLARTLDEVRLPAATSVSPPSTTRSVDDTAAPAPASSPTGAAAPTPVLARTPADAAAPGAAASHTGTPAPPTLLARSLDGTPAPGSGAPTGTPAPSIVIARSLDDTTGAAPGPSPAGTPAPPHVLAHSLDVAPAPVATPSPISRPSPAEAVLARTFDDTPPPGPGALPAGASASATVPAHSLDDAPAPDFALSPVGRQATHTVIARTLDDAPGPAPTPSSAGTPAPATAVAPALAPAVTDAPAPGFALTPVRRPAATPTVIARTLDDTPGPVPVPSPEGAGRVDVQGPSATHPVGRTVDLPLARAVDDGSAPRHPMPEAVATPVPAPTTYDPDPPVTVSRAAEALTAGATEVPIQAATDASVAPPSSTTAGAAAVPGKGDSSPEALEELAQRLLVPMMRHIRAEMLLDRERRGLRTDSW